MSNLDDDRVVLELAALTEDRTRGEQAAMKRVAKRVQRQWNSQARTNKPERYENPVDLIGMVEETRR